jgi:hypothetical protein
VGESVLQNELDWLRFAFWREVNLPFCKVHQYLQESETSNVNKLSAVLPVGTGGSLLAVETVA